jgi:hypothetical protein
VRACFSC